ncbi:MAG: ribosome-associated translation inhibitor RaiA [Myxococcota bacterium]
MEIEVRGRNLSLSEPLAFLVERRLDAALGRFASRIRRVDVKLADLNGPRGGVDKQCRVEVILDHGGSVRAEGTEEHVRDAIDLAVHRIGRRLGRRLDRTGSHRRGLRLAG